MPKKSVYPKNDSRKVFEHRQKILDWETIYKIASSLAAQTKKMLKVKTKNVQIQYTVNYIKTISLKPFLRYSTEYCGEKDGYLISSAARKKMGKSGIINFGVKGLFYMEHLIPIGQFADELIENPKLENVRYLYKKQRIVIMLREEKKKYEGANSPLGKIFKIHRSDEVIENFKKMYKITEL